MLGQGGVSVSPSKVKVAVPPSVPNTAKPHTIQAIKAVKLCEEAEGVKPHIIQANEAVKFCVTTPDLVKVPVPASVITVKGASPTSAPNLVEVTVPASVTTVEGTVPTTGKAHIIQAIKALTLYELAKFEGTVPTTVPHIIQAIEAVKLCEGAEGVDPVTTPNPVKKSFPCKCSKHS